MSASKKKPNPLTGISVQCDTCKWWRRGDLSPKNIGNVGSCLWMMPRSADFYAHTEHAPFWAAELISRTTSFDGEGCGTWVRASAKQIEENGR